MYMYLAYIGSTTSGSMPVHWAYAGVISMCIHVLFLCFILFCYSCIIPCMCPLGCAGGCWICTEYNAAKPDTGGALRLEGSTHLCVMEYCLLFCWLFRWWWGVCMCTVCLGCFVCCSCAWWDVAEVLTWEPSTSRARPLWHAIIFQNVFFVVLKVWMCVLFFMLWCVLWISCSIGCCCVLCY